MGRPRISCDFVKCPLPGGRIGRMSAPEGVTGIRASDLGARSRCSPHIIVSTDNDMRS